MNNQFKTSRANIANFLKQRRVALGMTQAQLAEKCDIRRESVNRIESAKFFLNTKQLLILCSVLGISLSLEGEEPKMSILINNKSGGNT